MGSSTVNILLRSEITMTFGEKVKAERTKLGMSQDELAAKIGVTRRIIGSYENDKSDVYKRQHYSISLLASQYYIEQFCVFLHIYFFRWKYDDMFLFFDGIVKCDLCAAFSSSWSICFVVVNDAIVAFIYHFIVAFDISGSASVSYTHLR